MAKVNIGAMREPEFPQLYREFTDSSQPGAVVGLWLRALPPVAQMSLSTEIDELTVRYVTGIIDFKTKRLKIGKDKRPVQPPSFYPLAVGVPRYLNELWVKVACTLSAMNQAADGVPYHPEVPGSGVVDRYSTDDLLNLAVAMPVAFASMMRFANEVNDAGPFDPTEIADLSLPDSLDTDSHTPNQSSQSPSDSTTSAEHFGPLPGHLESIPDNPLARTALSVG